ncbi:hypothetical protein F4778DRAFT_737750 [Xylariomycetidae sp. FL2044]|nr:hypothetical protein F4778DRAFT_737750 [Xylariomycetidae sp. FL2044]
MKILRYPYPVDMSELTVPPRQRRNRSRSAPSRRIPEDGEPGERRMSEPTEATSILQEDPVSEAPEVPSLRLRRRKWTVVTSHFGRDRGFSANDTMLQEDVEPGHTLLPQSVSPLFEEPGPDDDVHVIITSMCGIDDQGRSVQMDTLRAYAKANYRPHKQSQLMVYEAQRILQEAEEMAQEDPDEHASTVRQMLDRALGKGAVRWLDDTYVSARRRYQEEGMYLPIKKRTFYASCCLVLCLMVSLVWLLTAERDEAMEASLDLAKELTRAMNINVESLPARIEFSTRVSSLMTISADIAVTRLPHKRAIGKEVDNLVVGIEDTGLGLISFHSDTAALADDISTELEKIINSINSRPSRITRLLYDLNLVQLDQDEAQSSSQIRQSWLEAANSTGPTIHRLINEAEYLMSELDDLNQISQRAYKYLGDDGLKLETRKKPSFLFRIAYNLGFMDDPALSLSHDLAVVADARSSIDTLIHQLVSIKISLFDARKHITRLDGLVKSRVGTGRGWRRHFLPQIKHIQRQLIELHKAKPWNANWKPQTPNIQEATTRTPSATPTPNAVN